MGKRVLYIAGCVLVAHLVASYICVWCVAQRAGDLAANTFPPVLVTLSPQDKALAPLHVFGVLRHWGQTPGTAGHGGAFLWMSYLLPLLVGAAMLALAPRWLFVDDEKPWPRRRRRH